MSLVFVFNTI